MLSSLLPRVTEVRAMSGDQSAIDSSQKLAAFLEVFGGFTSRTGIEVTPTQARRLSVAHACVKVLAETVGWLPIIVYQRNGEMKKRAIGTGLYRLLHTRPNRWQTPLEFKEMLQGHAAMSGNAYALKVKVRGEVIELIPLHPGRMVVQQRENLSLVYTYARGDGKTFVFEQADIFHLRGMSDNGIVGLSPISEAREAIGLGIASERHGAMYFKNGVRSSGVVEHPQKLSDQAYARLKNSVEATISGDKLHSIMVLEEGLKWQEVGLNNEEAQFILTREFQVEDVARFWRMPPHKIGHLKRATNNNIEHQALEFVTDTMMPWLARWEQALMRDVFTPADELNGFFPEFLVDALMRGDSNARSNYFTKALAGKWMTPNEVRARENMDPVPWGDKPLETPGTPPSDQPPPDDSGSNRPSKQSREEEE